LYHSMDKSPTPREALLTVANVLIRINSKSNNVYQFYEPQKVLEVTDYWDLDVYKGFLIRHEAKINNALVELETWYKPAHHHAQVSKSIKLAKKIMQLDVSSDFDQKELVSRNFARILSEDTEPILILKLSGSSQVENSTANLTVLWVGPNEKVQETSELYVEDITITSTNFVKSNLRQPLTSGAWTVKVFHKKSLIGLTKFLITPSLATMAGNATINMNNLDKLIANFFLIKDTCISYNQKTIRGIVGSYLGAVDKEKEKSSIHKFVECKHVHWSSSSPDPKSELVNDFTSLDADGSS
jgi:Xylosyltransferase C terminal